MYTVAVIGPGEWGKKIITNLEKKCFLKYVVFTGSPQTRLWCEKNTPESQVVTDISSVLDDKTVTHVFITTPISTHPKLSKLCLKAGKNVFIEKPLSCDPKEVANLHQLAREKGVMLVTGYIYLYDNALKELCDILHHENQIELNLRWEKYGSFKESILENLLVHELAISYFLLGKYKNITESTIGVDEVYLKIQFARGIATIYINRIKLERMKIIEATTSNRTYRLNSGGLISLENKKEIFVANQNLLNDEIDSFFTNTTPFDSQALDGVVAEILTDISSQLLLNEC